MLYVGHLTNSHSNPRRRHSYFSSFPEGAEGAWEGKEICFSSQGSKWQGQGPVPGPRGVGAQLLTPCVMLLVLPLQRVCWGRWDVAARRHMGHFPRLK